MSVGDNPTEANVRPILPLPSARFPPEMKKISLYRVETVGGKEQLVQEPWRGGQKLYQTRMPNALVTTEFPDMPEFNAVTVKNLRDANAAQCRVALGNLSGLLRQLLNA